MPRTDKSKPANGSVATSKTTISDASKSAPASNKSLKRAFQNDSSEQGNTESERATRARTSQPQSVANADARPVLIPLIREFMAEFGDIATLSESATVQVSDASRHLERYRDLKQRRHVSLQQLTAAWVAMAENKQRVVQSLKVKAAEYQTIARQNHELLSELAITEPVNNLQNPLPQLFAELIADHEACISDLRRCLSESARQLNVTNGRVTRDHDEDSLERVEPIRLHSYLTFFSQLACQQSAQFETQIQEFQAQYEALAVPSSANASTSNRLSGPQFDRLLQQTDELLAQAQSINKTLRVQLERRIANDLRKTAQLQHDSQRMLHRAQLLAEKLTSVERTDFHVFRRTTTPEVRSSGDLGRDLGTVTDALWQLRRAFESQQQMQSARDMEQRRVDNARRELTSLTAQLQQQLQALEVDNGELTKALSQ